MLEISPPHPKTTGVTMEGRGMETGQGTVGFCRRAAGAAQGEHHLPLPFSPQAVALSPSL
jgi:hypothetical protein